MPRIVQNGIEFTNCPPKPQTLDGLSDVNITSVDDGEFLKYDEATGKWVNGTGGSSSVQALNDLSDVDITSATSGQVLKYDGTDWVNANESTGSTVSVTQVQSTGTKIATITVDSVGTDLYAPTGGGSSTLEDLTDVNITSVSDGQVLKYDSSSSKWVNGTGGGGGTSDYTDLTNKPQINGVTLSGDKDSEDLGIVWEGTQSQYDAIVTKDPNTTYFITDASDGGDNFQPIIYSNIEREIGVWTDGKPLYQQTFTKTVTCGSDQNVITTTDIPNLSEIVHYWGKFANIAPLDYYDSSNYRSYSYVNSNGLFLYAKFGSSVSVDVVVTLQYTKSTDTAGSGTWTPQGVPAQHYSTEEQVVGTWIDGKTLYEKTYAFLNQSYGGGGSAATDYNVTVTGLTGYSTIWIAQAFGLRTGYTIPLPYVHYLVDYQIGIFFNETNNTIGLRVGKSVAAITDLYVTFRYTKTS